MSLILGRNSAKQKTSINFNIFKKIWKRCSLGARDPAFKTKTKGIRILNIMGKFHKFS